MSVAAKAARRMLIGWAKQGRLLCTTEEFITRISRRPMSNALSLLCQQRGMELIKLPLSLSATISQNGYTATFLQSATTPGTISGMYWASEWQAATFSEFNEVLLYDTTHDTNRYVHF